MTRLFPVPMALWWMIAAAVIVVSIGVLIFLARHPVDGEVRILDLVHRLWAPTAVLAATVIYVVVPAPTGLASVLGVALCVVHFGSDSATEDRIRRRNESDF